MPYIIRTEPLKTGRELDGQMRPRLIELNQMGNNIYGKRRVIQNIRQDNTSYSEVWRRKYDGMGLHGLEWSRNTYKS